ncbi:antiviral reverse transcriptase Drt3a [Xanthomonas sp. 3307]|uniref:antiviral reverse transcriptase Drt3a n=1 Tax=Xanthomonas sp. 3307 TaxID=3035316 RepID=UPI0016170EC9|nr:antiviral reverse transcriptase Drt3a [Xanthomonas sp. 3307]MBB5941913.1 hypothetical protein [Xanthomonas sp. 3307]
MKPTQDFTAQNLFWMKGRRIPESLRRNSPKTKDDWLKLASSVEEDVARGRFRFTGIFSASASGKPALSTSNTADALVLRKINDNIRRAYGIRQTQRAQAVSLAKTALAEWTPKGVISLDLKSCFESITPREVIEKLREDAKVSTQTIHLLDIFLMQARHFGANKYTRGLPRGILVSSTLAELYLKVLDSKIGRMKGVYLYIRYVDDILVLATRQSKSVFEEISEIVKAQGLALNAAKLRAVDVGCHCAFECTHAVGKCPCANKCNCYKGVDNLEHIDYLGYRLIFSTGAALASPKCYAMVAKAKADKIKKKISRAVLDYKKTGDLDLLVDSVKYLTSNVTIDKSIRDSRLSSGVAFTYSQYEEPPQPHRFSDCSLDGIDKFLRTKLRRVSAAHSLSYIQRRELLRHSFVHGHEKKHRASFSKARVLQIKRTWGDVL